MGIFQDTFSNDDYISSHINSETSGGLLRQRDLNTVTGLTQTANDYVVTDASRTLQNISITFATWVKVTTNTTYPHIISCSQGGAFNNGFSIHPLNASSWRMSVDCGSPVYVTGGKYVQNRWTHVAGTWDKSDGTMKLYVDGQLIGTNTTTTTTMDTAYSLYFGRSGNSGGTSGLTGELAESVIYNRVLDAQEIAELASGTIDTSDTSLQLYYKYNDGSGSTVTDEMGNYDGTISGATWVTSRTPQAFAPTSQTITENVVSGTVTPTDFKYTPYNSPGGSMWARYSTDGSNYTFADGTSADDYGSYYFDNVNDYLIDTNPDFSSIGTGNFTLFFKFRTSESDTSGNIIIEKQSSNGLSAWYQSSTGILRIGWGTAVANYVQSTLLNLNDGNWHYVMFVRTSTTTAETWIDGRLETSKTGMTSLSLDVSADLYVGSRTASTYFMGGSISDIRLYSTNYGATEMEDYMQGRAFGSPFIWYKFAGDATDSGSAGYDLTVNGAVNTQNFYDNPFSGEVLKIDTDTCYFDGVNDYLSVADSDTLSFTDGAGTDSAFSIGGWFNLENLNQAGLFSKRDGSNYEYDLTFSNAGNILYFRIYQANTSVSMRAKTVAVPGILDGWVHIVATYDGSEAYTGMKIYINGEATTTTNEGNATITGMSNTTAPLLLCTATYNGDRFLKGRASNLFVAGYEMTASDIYTDMLNGYIDTSDANFVSYWKLNGDYNDSVGSNNATNNGSTYGYSFNRPESIVPTEQTIDVSGIGLTSSFQTMYLFNTNPKRTMTLTSYELDYEGGRRIIISMW